MRARPGPGVFPAVDRVIEEMERAGAGHQLHIGAVLEMDGPRPSLDEVRAHVRERLGTLWPVAGTADGEVAGPFAGAAADLSSRVFELVVPREGGAARPGGARGGKAASGTAGPDGVGAEAEGAYDALLNARVPGEPGRSWGVWLVHGHAPGRYLLCYRGHHALHDGNGVVRLMRLLFGAGGGRAAGVPARTVAATGRGTGTGTGPGAGGVRPRAAARLAGQVRSAAASVPLLLPAPRRPLLDGERAGRLLLSRAAVPLDRLRATSRLLECSVLDLHLAALSHAAQELDTTGWTEERRRSARGIGLPIALGPTEPGPYAGNRFSVALLKVPWREDDLVRRARRISRQTARYRDPAVRWALAASLDRFGPAGTRALSERIFARCGMQTTVLSSVADLGFGGRTALQVTGLNCLPAHFPYQSALTLGRELAVCAFTADAAVPGARSVARHWRAGLDVLAAAAGLGVVSAARLDSGSGRRPGGRSGSAR